MDPRFGLAGLAWRVLLDADAGVGGRADAFEVAVHGCSADFFGWAVLGAQQIATDDLIGSLLRGHVETRGIARLPPRGHATNPQGLRPA